MKKIILLFVIILAAYGGFAQSPVADGRIADTLTALTVNIPIGTKMYVVNRNAVYVCKVACASGTKISSMSGTGVAFANWTQLATGAAHDATTVTTGTGLSIVGQDVRMANAAADGSTKGTSTYTATDFDATSGVVSLDYVNGQKATSSVPGFMTAVQAAMLDTTTAKTGLATNYDLTSKLGTSLTSAYLFVGNGSNIATGVAMSSDATMSNTGAVTIANAAVSLAKMANLAQNTIIGRVTGSTGVPEALTGANVRTISATNCLTQKFENTTADSTNYTCTLTNTPQAIGTLTVSLNGQELDPASQYTIIMTNKVRISVPSSKYDKFIIRYNY